MHTLHTAQACCHSRHLSTEIAQTLAWSCPGSSPILSRINYCNAVFHGLPTGTIQKLQRVQNSTAEIVLQVTRWCHAKPLLHWLPDQQWVTYKLAVLRQITEHACGQSVLIHQNHSPVDFLDALSAFHHCLSGTHCCRRFSLASSDLDSKPICSTSHFLTTDLTCCQHLWSRDCILL